MHVNRQVLVLLELTLTQDREAVSDNPFKRNNDA